MKKIELYKRTPKPTSYDQVFYCNLGILLSFTMLNLIFLAYLLGNSPESFSTATGSLWARLLRVDFTYYYVAIPICFVSLLINVLLVIFMFERVSIRQNYFSILTVTGYSRYYWENCSEFFLSKSVGQNSVLHQVSFDDFKSNQPIKLSFRIGEPLANLIDMLNLYRGRWFDNADIKTEAS